VVIAPPTNQQELVGQAPPLLVGEVGRVVDRGLAAVGQHAPRQRHQLAVQPLAGVLDQTVGEAAREEVAQVAPELAGPHLVEPAAPVGVAGGQARVGLEQRIDLDHLAFDRRHQRGVALVVAERGGAGSGGHPLAGLRQLGPGRAPDQAAREVVDPDHRGLGVERTHPGVPAVEVEAIGDLIAADPDRLVGQALGLGDTHCDRLEGDLAPVGPGIQGEECGEDHQNEQDCHGSPPFVSFHPRTS
jgi:hypothetical protein